MFANALKSVIPYTHPLVISQRFFDGTVECGIATYIVINKEGWIMTSAHVLGALLYAQKHEKEIAEYEKRETEIKSNPKLKPNQRKRMLQKLIINNKWITNQSYWWGQDGVKVDDYIYNSFRDLAIGKIESFDEKSISAFPTFKNPQNELLTGTSLCKLGFPFHQIKATFDESANVFSFEPGALPMPRFPLEGIHTRVSIIIHEKTKDKAKFIETSSPGLRGQSGGPIFDTDGNIWGLQSRTNHLALGFSPKKKTGKKEVEEHQFISVGIGTHVEEIVNFLTDNNIEFNLEAVN